MDVISDHIFNSTLSHETSIIKHPDFPKRAISSILIIVAIELVRRALIRLEEWFYEVVNRPRRVRRRLVGMRLVEVRPGEEEG